MSENYRQAPRLYHSKEAYNYGNFYQLPQAMMDKIFQKLDGKHGSQIKLLVVLLGTIGNGSFRVSEEWVRQRTGMSQVNYNVARKALVEKGWMVLTDDGCVVIDVNAIMGD